LVFNVFFDLFFAIFRYALIQLVGGSNPSGRAIATITGASYEAPDYFTPFLPPKEF
jgi:hypothetical protein